VFFFPARGYRKFMILSSPRSGTHMLRTSLDAHRNVVCLTEMFNPDYTLGRYDFTENSPEQEILEQYIFRPQPRRIHAVGFCLHRTGARFGNWPGLWETLAAMPDLRIISLSRRNLLRRYLSFKRRPTRTGPWLPTAPITVDKNELAADFEYHAAKLAEFDLQFREHPLLGVTYEDLCTNYQTTMEAVFAFLEVPYRPVKPATPKLPRQSLAEAIQNYWQLKQEFAGTKWAALFEE
jgi:hypothetical protein